MAKGFLDFDLGTVVMVVGGVTIMVVYKEQFLKLIDSILDRDGGGRNGDGNGDGDGNGGPCTKTCTAPQVLNTSRCRCETPGGDGDGDGGGGGDWCAAHPGRCGDDEKQSIIGDWCDRHPGGCGGYPEFVYQYY